MGGFAASVWVGSLESAAPLAARRNLECGHLRASNDCTIALEVWQHR